MPRTRTPTPVLVPATQIDEVYPQLVTRLMAAAYLCQRVALVRDPLRCGRSDVGQYYGVLDPEPNAGEALTPARRQAVVAAAREASDRLHLPCCAVFGPFDAVYVRPGQAKTRAGVAPSGGVQFGQMAFVGPAGGL